LITLHQTRCSAQWKYKKSIWTKWKYLCLRYQIFNFSYLFIC